MLSAIPKLIEGAVADLQILARQYAQLSRLKAKERIADMAAGGAMIAVALGLGVVGIAELIFGFVARLILDSTGISARTAGLTGLLTSIVAALIGFIGVTLWRKIEAENGNEEESWQATN